MALCGPKKDRNGLCWAQKGLFGHIFGPPAAPAGSYKFTPVRPSVHLFVSFLRICSLVFSETLQQVRGPEMKKSDRARFLDKTPYLVISGGNVGKNRRFYFSFEISALVLAAIGAN